MPPRQRILRAAIAVATAALAGAGCGEGAPQSADRPVVVSAAASLKTAFTAYSEAFDGGRARFSFAGSDELAAQIRQGVKPDVFAAANTRLPEELHDEGLVEKPVVFAGNRLVLAIPGGEAQDGKVRTLEDLAKKGVTIAVGAKGVPVGAYTRTVLDRLPDADQKSAILANVRSEEPDVAGVVGKISQGAVDAGFVYISDVDGAEGRLDAIELPAELQPDVKYGIAVVRGAKNPAGAKAFVDGLLAGPGAAALQDAGLERP